MFVVNTGSGHTKVKIGLYVNSFDDINEQNMEFSVNFYLRQRWNDPRLRFPAFNNTDPKEYHIKLDDIWKSIWVPDVYFRNEKVFWLLIDLYVFIFVFCFRHLIFTMWQNRIVWCEFMQMAMFTTRAGFIHSFV